MGNEVFNKSPIMEPVLNWSCFCFQELVSNVLHCVPGSPEKEKALADLEHIGFNAGYRLIEKLTREYPNFKDELDLMKFVCKDFWTCVFKKQIDNLRTNHQGVYVLQVTWCLAVTPTLKLCYLSL